MRDLRRAGRLTFYIGFPGNLDSSYAARAWIKTDGTVGKRLRFVVEGGGPQPPACPGLKASWSAVRNVVSLTVPHSCLGFFGFRTKESFMAKFRAKSHPDYGPSRDVGRGSSPGCVTRTEFYAAKKGMTKTWVHAMWDTPGKLRDADQGVVNRGYRICNVKGLNVFAEFAKREGAWRLSERRPICSSASRTASKRS